MKFFRRKKKARDEARQHYRHAPGSKQALTVRVLPVGHQTWIAASVADTSAGGAAVSIPAGKDPKLQEGDSLVLSFGSLRSQGEVMAHSLVRARIEEEGSVRYGCAFQDPSSLLEGLDPYFLKFFNRRARPRVRSELGREIPVDVRADDGGWRLKMFDVSAIGVGVVVGADELPWIQATDRFDIEFRIPKSEMSFMRYASRVHVTQVSGTLRAGLTFEEPEGGPGIELEELTKWLEAREAAMKQWDKSY